ncbi:MAG: hypothetical protein EBS39_02150 [Gammaproteobacteria bacterium]|nr:hypothetical protein [Gammaproteobacteria bacterium]
MLRASAVLTLLALGAATSPQAAAACFRNEPGYLWNFDGQIAEKYPVRMTLVFSGDKLDGVYTYRSRLRDIRLRGRIEGGKTVVLDELDDTGRVTARFEGEFATRDPKGRYGDSELACEVIVGRWSKVGSAEQLGVYLATEGSTAGSLKHRYGAIGVRDDEVVHGGAARFWRAVKAGDRATVAAQLRYPIAVTLDGKARRLKGQKDLLPVYDAVFTPKFVAAILDSTPRYMFVRDEGAMLGSGWVWFGADGKVTALNNF